MDALRATEINEKPLVAFLFTERPSARLIWQELKFPPGGQPIFEVPTRDLAPNARGPGDIDVLVVDRNSLGQSIAFEVKRIKVDAETFHTRMPGKVSELLHGVEQVNRLAELGFHQTYLLVVIVTDGRQRHDLAFPFRSATSEILNIVRNFKGREKLHPNSGLVFLELTQAIDKDIRLAGSVGIQILIEAKRVEQSIELERTLSHYVQAIGR